MKVDDDKNTKKYMLSKLQKHKHPHTQTTYFELLSSELKHVHLLSTFTPVSIHHYRNNILQNYIIYKDIHMQ